MLRRGKATDDNDDRQANEGLVNLQGCRVCVPYRTQTQFACNNAPDISNHSTPPTQKSNQEQLNTSTAVQKQGKAWRTLRKLTVDEAEKYHDLIQKSFQLLLCRLLPSRKSIKRKASKPCKLIIDQTDL